MMNIKTNASNTIIRLAANSIIKFVENGNWIGASWYRYIPGMKFLTDDEKELAMEMAETLNPYLWGDSQRNFEQDSWEQDQAMLQAEQELASVGISSIEYDYDADLRLMKIVFFVDGTVATYAMGE